MQTFIFFLHSKKEKRKEKKGKKRKKMVVSKGNEISRNEDKTNRMHGHSERVIRLWTLVVPSHSLGSREAG